MSTTTSLDIYHLLVDAGISEAKADPLAKEILTRTEALETLVTKQDLKDEFSGTTRWIISVFIGIAFGQMAIMIGAMSFLLNFYLKVLG